MMAQMLTIDLFICTRDRQETLLTHIELLSSSSEASEVRLVIVDNSNLNEDALVQLRNEVQKFSSSFRSLELITSTPGLVYARNMSIENIKSEIAIFIDDDVRLPLNFFHRIREIFSQNNDIVGCSPLISGLYSTHSKQLRRLIKYFPNLQGKITRTSHTFWVDDSATRNFEVQWLPGCCMAYRSEAISDKRFSEALLNGALGGYSLGEDVDFSSRVAADGKLICASGIKIFHDLSPINRGNDERMQLAIGQWRRYAAQNILGTSQVATLAFEFLHIVISQIRGKRFSKLANFRRKGYFSIRMRIQPQNQGLEELNDSQ